MPAYRTLSPSLLFPASPRILVAKPITLSQEMGKSFSEESE